MAKVLLLSASAGAGHVRAAQSLERAFGRLDPACDVRHVDALDYTTKLFRRVYSKAYIELVQSTPQLLGWLYDWLDQPWEMERRRLALDRLNSRRFVKMLERERPDLVICTHFLPAEIVSWLLQEARLDCAHAVVVTDFDVHAMWLCRRFDHYFVALDETRVHLERLGIPAGKISVTGIPIDPAFSEPRDRRAARERLGLATDRTVLLLSAGGFGVGPLAHLVESLLELTHPAEVVAICGRNEDLRERLERLAETRRGDGVALAVVGYTTEMHEYMAAADLLVGKPGGLTTSEALASGLVLVIVNPIPGQEERNADHLLEQGAAIRCNNLPALAWKIDRLLDDPERLAAMRGSAARLARPRAAEEIARRSLALLG